MNPALIAALREKAAKAAGDEGGEMSTAVERCACGKHVMEWWRGWYGDEWGVHARGGCMRVAGACRIPEDTDLIAAVDSED